MTYAFLYQQCRVYRQGRVKLLTECYNLPRHGPQGIHNEASNATLENEFGTSNGDEAILKILDQGEIQENVVSKSLSPKYLALDQHMPNHWS